MRKNKSILFGIIAGVSTIAYYLLFYFLLRERLFELPIWWGGLIPIIFIMIRGTLALRKSQNGALELLQGLRTAFLIYVIGILLFYIFYYLLVRFDPELLQIQQQTALKNLERFGNNQQMEAFEDYYQQEELTITIGALVFRYLQSLIGGFIVSLPIAFSLRTK